MRHTIKTDILQKVLNYLSSKPFTEVSALINEVMSDAKPVDQSAELVNNTAEQEVL